MTGAGTCAAQHEGPEEPFFALTASSHHVVHVIMWLGLHTCDATVRYAESEGDERAAQSQGHANGFRQYDARHAHRK